MCPCDLIFGTPKFSDLCINHLLTSQIEGLIAPYASSYFLKASAGVGFRSADVLTASKEKRFRMELWGCLVFGDEQSDVILDEAFNWVCALQCA